VPCTHKSLACFWLITLGLFALTASGVVARSWLPLLLLVALTASALILRSPNPVAVIAGSRNRPRIVAEARDQSPWNLGAIDVDPGHPECRRLNRLRGPIDRRVQERAARFSALSARRKQLQSVFDYGIRTRKPSSYPSWNAMR
jgi:hypothetical protein